MRRTYTMIILSAGMLLLFDSVSSANPEERPRLIILTDIGGDPDDRQSMVRLMTHANDFEIEGLIASAAGTPGELDEHVVRRELIREIVDAYGQVRENLLRHADGYPPAEQLGTRIKAGNPRRGVEQLGAEHDSEGSRWIIQVVDRDDPRPVNIAIWGGSTELAQALWRVRHKRSDAELEEFVSNIRVHAIGHQDDTGPWIIENFPKLFYILDRNPDDKLQSVYRGMFLGGDESLTSREWINTHVRHDHGPLGALYPPKTWTASNPHSALKEGDTPSWFYFLPHGLNEPAHPEWGGWGGRFRHIEDGLYGDAEDTVDGKTHARATVWRWRPAYQADFQARMDWCVKPPNEANHHPIAVLNGDESKGVVRLQVPSGETVALSADGSRDPDGDELSFRWFRYDEADDYEGSITTNNSNKKTARFMAPAVDRPTTVHVILEVQDNGSPGLYSYRRVVVEIM